MEDLISLAANQYYILEIALLYIADSIDVVGTAQTVRKNIAGTKFIMKTKDGIVDLPAMSSYQKFSHTEALEEMQDDMWSGEEEI